MATNSTQTPDAERTAGSLHRDCSALRNKFEVLAYRNRGGNYRKNPIEGPIETAAETAIRMMRQVEAQIDKIAKAQNTRLTDGENQK